jgi:hypothetical protein
MSATIIDARSNDLGEYLRKHRFASLFSSPEWIEVIARTYKIDIMASIAFKQGIHAAILFSHIRDVRGDRVVCLPFSDYCDPLIDDAGTWNELVEPLLSLGAQVGVRCLRNCLPAEDSRFALHRRAKWHGVDLNRAEDEMWAGLSGQARQNIRHARQSGIVVREGRSVDDVRIFHRMHAHTRKSKYRLLAQPFAFFENLHEIFAQGDRITVLIAELDGTPVAGIFLLLWQNVLYYKFNASIDQRFRPNDLLVWHSMLLGRHRGLTMLDFGLSDPEQEGLVRYKKKFATVERDICFFERQPKMHSDARGEEASKILRSMTELLTDPAVPDDITEAAGEKFYRLFA